MTLPVVKILSLDGILCVGKNKWWYKNRSPQSRKDNKNRDIVARALTKIYDQTTIKDIGL